MILIHSKNMNLSDKVKGARDIFQKLSTIFNQKPKNQKKTLRFSKISGNSENNNKKIFITLTNTFFDSLQSD